MIYAKGMRVSCKPAVRPCFAHVVVRPSRHALCKAQQDPVKTAQDFINAGVSALKTVDADKLKAAAAQAQAQAGCAVNMSAAAIKSCIDTALGTWSSYDKDGDGKLSISEAVALLNSPEVSAAVQKATGMDHTTRTEADIKKWFDRADLDSSKSLSKREFVVMYVGLMCSKAKVGAGGLASALCAALDTDGDGKIGSTELKKLLAGRGLTLISNVANMIPDGKDINYRDLLAKFQ